MAESAADRARAVVKGWEHCDCGKCVYGDESCLADRIATALRAERAAVWREAAGFLQDMADHGDGEVDPEEIAAALRQRAEEAGG